MPQDDMREAPPIAPGFCRIAAAQLDFHAAAWLKDASPLAHPLGDASAGPGWGVEGAVPKHLRRSLGMLADGVRGLYVRQLRTRLEAVVRFLADLGVEIAVLPEYAVPPELLPWLRELLSDVAPELLLVAGTHGVAPEGADEADAYVRAGYTGARPQPQTSVAPVFHGGELVALFPKLALTDLERQGGVAVPDGEPAERVLAWTEGREAWVAICRDFLEGGRSSVPEPPAPGRVLLVPALTPAKTVPDAFEPKLREAVRRAQCPVAFANRAAEGGTRVWPLIAAGLKLDDFPILDADEEGVVVVDVDLNAYPGAATAPFPARPQSRAVCVTGLLYAARESDRRHAELVADGCSIASSKELVAWLKRASLEADESTPGRRARWASLALRRGFADLDEPRGLMREIVVEADALPLPALERALSEGVAKALEPLRDAHEEVDGFVRALRRKANKLPTPDTDGGRETESRLIEALGALRGHFAMAPGDVRTYEQLESQLVAGDYAAAGSSAGILLGRDDLGSALRAHALAVLVEALHGTTWEVPGDTGSLVPIPVNERGELVRRASAAARGLTSYGSQDDPDDVGASAIREIRRRLMGIVHDPEVVGLPPEDALVILTPPLGGPWLGRFVAATRGRDLDALRSLHAEFPDAAPVAFLLADIAQRIGEVVEGLAAARRAFALLPGMGQRLKLAELLTVNGRLSDVEELLGEVAELGVNGRLILANARAALGDDAAALAVLAEHAGDLSTTLQRHHLSRHTEPLTAERAWKAYDAASPEARSKVPPQVLRHLADQLRADAAGTDAAQSELRRRLRGIAEVLSARVPSLETDVALLMVSSGLREEDVSGLRRVDLEQYSDRGDVMVVGHGIEGFNAFVADLMAHHDRIERLHRAGLVSFEALGVAQPRVWFERAAAVFGSDGSVRFPAVPGKREGTAAKTELRGPMLLGPLEVLVIVRSGVRIAEFAAFLGPGAQFALFEDTVTRLHQGVREVLDATYGWRGDKTANDLATLAERVQRWLVDGRRAGLIELIDRPQVDAQLPEGLAPELSLALDRWEALAQRQDLGMAVADEVEIGRSSVLSPFIALRERIADRDAFRRVVERYAPHDDRTVTLAELLVRASGPGKRADVVRHLIHWGVCDAFVQEGAVEALVPSAASELPAVLLDAHEAASRERIEWALGTGGLLVVERVLRYGALFTALAQAERVGAAQAVLDRAERLGDARRTPLLGTLAALKTLSPTNARRRALDRWCQGGRERRSLYRLSTRLTLSVPLRLGPLHARLAVDDLFAETSAPLTSMFTLDGMYERAVLAAAWSEAGPLPVVADGDLESVVIKGVSIAVNDVGSWEPHRDLVVVETEDGALWLPSAVLVLRAPPGWAAEHVLALSAAARILDGRLADALAALAEAPDDAQTRERVARHAIDSTARICASSPQGLWWLDMVLGRAGAQDTVRELRELLSEPPPANDPFELAQEIERRRDDPRWKRSFDFELYMRATTIPLSHALFGGTGVWTEQGAVASRDALEALRHPEQLTTVELSRYLFVTGRVAASESWVTLSNGEVIELRPRLVDTFVMLLSAAPPAPADAGPTVAGTEAVLARLALNQLGSLRRGPSTLPTSDAEMLYLVGVLRKWMADVLANADVEPRRHFLEDLVRRERFDPKESRHVLNPVGWGGEDGLDLRTASVLFALFRLTLPDADGPASGWRPVRADLVDALLALASRPLTPIERQLRHPTPEDVALGVGPYVAVPDLALAVLVRLDLRAAGRLSSEVRSRLVRELPRTRDGRDGAPWELVWSVLVAVAQAGERPLDPEGVLSERVAGWIAAHPEDPAVGLGAALVAEGGEETANLALHALASRAPESADQIEVLLTNVALLGSRALFTFVARLVDLGIAPGELTLRLATLAVDALPAIAEAGRATLLELARTHALHDDERVAGLLLSLGLAIEDTPTEDEPYE